jgi:hypothetical protein
MVKSGTYFEQAADAPAQLGPTLCGLGDAAQDLEQRALSCAIAAYHADDLALGNLEADVAQRPKAGALQTPLARLRARSCPGALDSPPGSGAHFGE